MTVPSIYTENNPGIMGPGGAARGLRTLYLNLRELGSGTFDQAFYAKARHSPLEFPNHEAIVSDSRLILATGNMRWACSVLCSLSIHKILTVSDEETWNESFLFREYVPQYQWTGGEMRGSLSFRIYLVSPTLISTGSQKTAAFFFFNATSALSRSKCLVRTKQSQLRQAISAISWLMLWTNSFTLGRLTTLSKVES